MNELPPASPAFDVDGMYGVAAKKRVVLVVGCCSTPSLEVLPLDDDTIVDFMPPCNRWHARTRFDRNMICIQRL
jgi:hypothetical protein